MTRGEYMRRARQQAGLTIVQLGKLTGISADCIGQYERERNIPHVDVVEILADALGLSIDEYTGHKVIRRQRRYVRGGT